MKNHQTSDSKIPKNNDPDIIEIKGHNINPVDLSSDPDYPKLLEHYQNAEFDLCKMFVDKLEKRYPDNPELLKFKEDLEIKLSLKTMAVESKKRGKRKKRRVTLNMSIFTIFGTIVVLIAFFLSYDYLTTDISASRLDEQATQLTSLNNQAEQLLAIGKPQTAGEVIERMKLINPDFENLPELTVRTEELLKLEAKYQSALSFVAENKHTEALQLFKEIQTDKQGMWDVSQQISSIETILQIEKYLAEGNTASQEENWDLVISAYENALLLDPKLDDPLMREQMLKGYLNKIISMLQDEKTAIEDVEQAEQYYRKAVALIPQNKEFANERGNLEELSSNLLEQKYSHTAKAMLADKNQTVSSIAKAVSYIRKAANIKPKNTVLQQEVKNAEYYQIAFQNFVDMDWVLAISNLNEILYTDKYFANGNAIILLYEAYYALGKQYYSAGLYQDALKNLEQAEILAWEDSDNLLKLFQVQVLSGDTLGHMGEYENAVSYYKYALNVIEIIPRLIDYPMVTSRYSRANVLAGNANFEDAFTVFREVFQGIDFIYSISEIEINSGVCLALFAHEHLSTMDALLETNDLSKNMIITFGRSLIVPMIEN